jgi:hypothetical protein
MYSFHSKLHKIVCPSTSFIFKFTQRIMMKFAIGIDTKKGTQLIETSDLASVSQCGSGSSSNFQAKVLCVNTPVFLSNTQFNFPLSSLSFCKTHRSWCTYIVSNSSDGSILAYKAVSWGFRSQWGFFLFTMSVMAFEAIKFNLLFNSLHLFILLIPLFTFKNEKSRLRLL